MSDALTVGIIAAIATLISPFLAVQSQKWIEESKEKKRRKVHIFETLMATRASRTVPNHVMALNAIDLEFKSKKPKDRAVLEAWRVYFDHLHNVPDESKNPEKFSQQQEIWNQKNEELFVDLLKALSDSLGYSFDKVQLKRGVYYPRAHGEAELDQYIIRKAFLKILTGEMTFPMDVKSFPISPEAFELQQKLNAALLKTLSNGSLQVIINPHDQASEERAKQTEHE